MTPERWRRIEELYHQARTRPADARGDFLAGVCAGDADLHREVEALLANASGDGFLSTPAFAAVIADAPGPPLTGRRIGVYQLQERIGAGGMGEVYRARDAKLGRDVAIKMLPSAFVTDPDRRARFEREARMLAALNHPNIGSIYGVEESDSTTGRALGLVLEMVEGDTLRERLQRGPMPLAAVLDVAAQIAAALEAAHEKGIVHRDLKPANIKVTPDGIVKVLDFGLAKIAAGDESGAALSQAPTATFGGTREGAILGTVAYMSPEQARGHAVDKRTDIWAFGCVLYEMLTGRGAFSRATASDTIAAIMERTPDWSALPASTPPRVRRLLQRCLEKDPKRRLRDIGDARMEIEDASTPEVVDDRDRGSRTAQARRAIPWVLAAAVVAGILGWRLRPIPTAPPAEGRRIERMTFDAGLTTSPALSPDGRLVAYASNRSSGRDLDIWVEQTGRGSPVRLTDDPADDRDPDFSPDGSQIVFRSERGGGGVYLAPALGGTPRLLVQDGRDPRFSPDGKRIVYWTGQFRGDPASTRSSVYILALNGGAPVQVLSTFRVARDPVWAPDGGSLLVMARPDSTSPINEVFDFWWVPLDGRPPAKSGALALNDWRAAQRRETIHLGAWNASAVLFSVGGGLWSLPLSPTTGQRTGPAVPLAVGAGDYGRPTASTRGDIVFGDLRSQRVIERVPLSGPTPSEIPPMRVYEDANPFSWRTSQTRDGSTIVFERPSGGRIEVVQKDLRSNEQHAIVVVDSVNPTNPTISPDAARIAYTITGRGYVVDVRRGVPRQVCDECGVWSFLSDSRRLVTTRGDSTIRLVDITTGSTRDVITSGEGPIDRPSVSPDARWIAFRRIVNASATIFVTRLRPADQGPAPAQEWATVDQQTATGRPAGWSPDSRILYLLLDADGFRCLWAQNVDEAGRLVGKPYPARHFHDWRSPGLSTTLDNAVSPAGFLYETAETTGSLWRFVNGP